jgi:hypothetical protein
MRRTFGAALAALRLSKALGSFAAVVVVAAIVVPVASSSKPVIEPLPAEDFTLPADFCGFEVAYEAEYGSMTLGSTSSPGGESIFVRCSPRAEGLNGGRGARPGSSRR